eukprot:m.364427 g.364427  ORF g.364427 m.364427 type:complete len:600 (+) comp26965_c0_seq1:26-1825(+)
MAQRRGMQRRALQMDFEHQSLIGVTVEYEAPLSHNAPTLEHLDAKLHMNLLGSVTAPSSDAHQVRFNSKLVHEQCPLFWTANLLTKEECEAIIHTSERAGFQSLQGYDSTYRNSTRLLVFDPRLHKLINERLEHDCFKRRFAEQSDAPYGLRSLKFSKDVGVNPCFRINRYQHVEKFDYHRDAQYIGSETIRSGYTMIVYLNDHDSETEFIMTAQDAATYAKAVDGVTVSEELKYIQETCPDSAQIFKVKPRAGQALIFHQRLLHRGVVNMSTEPKYVLRTDLTRFVSHVGEEYCPERSLLAKKLFHCAQIRELQQLPATQHYELAQSLQVHAAQQGSLSIDTKERLQSYLSEYPDTYKGPNFTVVERAAGRIVVEFSGEVSVVLKALMHYVAVTENGRFVHKIETWLGSSDYKKHDWQYDVEHVVSQLGWQVLEEKELQRRHVGKHGKQATSSEGDHDEEGDEGQEAPAYQLETPCIEHSGYCCCGLGYGDGALKAQHPTGVPKLTHCAHDVLIKGDASFGTVTLISPGRSYNHASCQCHVHELDPDGTPTNRTSLLSFHATYEVLSQPVAVASVDSAERDGSSNAVLSLSFTPLVEL